MKDTETVGAAVLEGSFLLPIKPEYVHVLNYSSTPKHTQTFNYS
jgi:hypothetical protein